MSLMYFVALILPKHLDQRILAWKQQLHERFGCKVGLKSPAHITVLSPFWMPAEDEAALIGELEMLAVGVQAFSLRTQNFSSFGERTLFVAVEESGALQELKRSVDGHFTSTDYVGKKETRPFHPHITLATRDLHKKDFAAVWPEFATKTFREEFVADGLALLRHNGTKWDVLHTARFNQSTEADVTGNL